VTPNQNKSSVLVEENESLVSYDPISYSNDALSAPITAFAVASLQKRHQRLSGSEIRRALYLLLNLQSIDDRGELAENLVCLLVELELCRDQVGEVSERLGSIKHLALLALNLSWRHNAYILHDANGLLCLANKLVLGLLNLDSGFLRRCVVVTALSTRGVLTR
jgi:hypothetical protein